MISRKKLYHNVSGYNNHLIPLKTVEKIKECDFLCVGENAEKYIFFCLEKKFEKENPTVKVTTKVIC